MTGPKEGTHGARLLAVLADGKPHTTREIHRRAGNMIVHSRVAELRKRYGYRIECEHVAKRKGAAAYRYTWVDAPAPEPTDEPEPLFSWDDLAPRRPEEQYRFYVKRAGQDLQLVATCEANDAALGLTLRTLAEEGQLERANFGLLDIEGGKGGAGRWLVSPFETGTW